MTDLQTYYIIQEHSSTLPLGPWIVAEVDFGELVSGQVLDEDREHGGELSLGSRPCVVCLK